MTTITAARPQKKRTKSIDPRLKQIADEFCPNADQHEGNSDDDTDAIASQAPAQSTEARDDGEYLPAVPIADVHPSATNPRQHFDEAELNALAQSFRESGVLQPILVRPRPKQRGYEIVAGERRHRAACRAGLHVVPVISRDMTDRQALVAQVIENYQRRELNAIEEAEGFRRLTLSVKDGGAGMTQQQVADEVGVSQGQIANRIRLLKLPASLRKMVIAGKLPASHAREILPYLEFPTLMKVLEKNVAADCGSDGGVSPLEVFRQEVVEDAIYLATEDIEGETWFDGRKVRWSIQLTDERRAQLGIIEIKDHLGRPILRATNQKLARKLRDEAKAHALAGVKQQKPTKAAAKVKAKPPTPAELKKKKADAEKVTAKRVEIWRTNWLRYECARVLRADKTVNHLRAAFASVRMLIYFALHGPSAQHSHHYQLQNAEHRQRRLDQFDLAAWAGSATRGNKQWRAAMMIPPDAETFDRVINHWTADCLCPIDVDSGVALPTEMLPPAEVESLAGELSIDLEKAWRADKAGPLTAEYWELHTKDQLAALGKECGVFLDQAKSKGDMLKLLAASTVPMPLPREIKRLPAAKPAKPVSGWSARVANSKAPAKKRKAR